MPSLDPHERPPDDLKAIFKQYQKASLGELFKDPAIIDFNQPATISHSGLNQTTEIDAANVRFQSKQEDASVSVSEIRAVPVFQSLSLPGLCQFPVQTGENRLIHQDYKSYPIF